MTSIGSPPLTRGPPYGPCISGLGYGITPAYAGTTSEHQTAISHSKDHPRLRGDHSYSLRSMLPIVGSPPLTRGPRHRHGHRAGLHRITPAYAGTTHRASCWQTSWRDHPRLRGDHLPDSRYPWRALGSPPLTRGPLPRGSLINEFKRITPAYAGTTTWTIEFSGPRPDHPRLRGDHGK